MWEQVITEFKKRWFLIGWESSKIQVEPALGPVACWQGLFGWRWEKRGIARGWVPDMGGQVLREPCLPLLGSQAEDLATKVPVCLLDRGIHCLRVERWFFHQMSGILVIFDEGFVDRRAVRWGENGLEEGSCEVSHCIEKEEGRDVCLAPVVGSGQTLTLWRFCFQPKKEDSTSGQIV